MVPTDARHWKPIMDGSFSGLALTVRTDSNNPPAGTDRSRNRSGSSAVFSSVGQTGRGLGRIPGSAPGFYLNTKGKFSHGFTHLGGFGYRRWDFYTCCRATARGYQTVRMRLKGCKSLTRSRRGLFYSTGRSVAACKTPLPTRSKDNRPAFLLRRIEQ